MDTQTQDHKLILDNLTKKLQSLETRVENLETRVERVERHLMDAANQLERHINLGEARVGGSVGEEQAAATQRLAQHRTKA